MLQQLKSSEFTPLTKNTIAVVLLLARMRLANADRGPGDHSEMVSHDNSELVPHNNKRVESVRDTITKLVK